ncbi:MAG: hypothetical protein AMXMBFR23_16840 [Chloroflexota bacterium]
MAFAVDDELAFLRTYESTTLTKPQVVADNVLTGIFLADSRHRAALAALLLQEAVEAARRLAAVWDALAHRSRSVAEALAGPLPNATVWEALAGAVTGLEDPREVLRLIQVDESALESAEEMLEFAGLDWFSAAIRTFEAGPPALTLEPGEPGSPGVVALRGVGTDGSPRETRVRLEDDRIIALGDATGDFVTWSRDFLGAYMDAREAAAQRR